LFAFRWRATVDWPSDLANSQSKWRCCAGWKRASRTHPVARGYRGAGEAHSRRYPQTTRAPSLHLSMDVRPID
jgi:hypothetical protein